MVTVRRRRERFFRRDLEHAFPPYYLARRSGQTPQSFAAGQAALSFILLVSGIIIEIAIAGSFVTFFLSTSGLGERLSARAFAAAQSGVRDAQIKIVRNKDFASVPKTYSLTIGDDIVSVEVTRTGSGVYAYTINSTGVASTRERKLTSVLAVDATTGLVQLGELEEVAL